MAQQDTGPDAYPSQNPSTSNSGAGDSGSMTAISESLGGGANNATGNSDNQGAGEEINLKSDMREAVAPIKEALMDAIDERRGMGADRLETLAGVIKDAAPALERDMPQVASYIRQAGEWVENSANDVREQKFENLLRKAGDFARQQPVAAFGIAALSGFLLSRFLKSAPPPAAPQTVH